MPGRKPKPTAIRKLHGNAGHRPINTAEPSFMGRPKCPTWLSKEAKAEFRRIQRELSDLDMLKATDQTALAAYCQAYARWQSAERTVCEEGQTFKEPVLDKTGKVVGSKIRRHPATIIARDERASMLKAASLFGFDPSSRSRIVMPQTTETTEIDDDFNLFATSEDGSRVLH